MKILVLGHGLEVLGDFGVIVDRRLGCNRVEIRPGPLSPKQCGDGENGWFCLLKILLLEDTLPDRLDILVVRGCRADSCFADESSAVGLFDCDIDGRGWPQLLRRDLVRVCHGVTGTDKAEVRAKSRSRYRERPWFPTKSDKGDTNMASKVKGIKMGTGSLISTWSDGDLSPMAHGNVDSWL